MVDMCQNIIDIDCGRELTMHDAMRFNSASDQSLREMISNFHQVLPHELSNQELGCNWFDWDGITYTQEVGAGDTTIQFTTDTCWTAPVAMILTIVDAMDFKSAHMLTRKLGFNNSEKTIITNGSSGVGHVVEPVDLHFTYTELDQLTMDCLMCGSPDAMHFVGIMENAIPASTLPSMTAIVDMVNHGGRNVAFLKSEPNELALYDELLELNASLAVTPNM